MTPLLTAAATVAGAQPAFVPEPGKTCVCGDPQVERLRDLIAQGWDQINASKLIWGGPDARPTPPAYANQAPRYVRARLAIAFPWLRLPKEGT